MKGRKSEKTSKIIILALKTWFFDDFRDFQKIITLLLETWA